mmetsp:Transcript_63523/g.145525  ORF Transcript_63523/g.145525 Transcript_63523/m.145525 type:complete len:436 (+) Transcript_63523:1135-2442(+)
MVQLRDPASHLRSRGCRRNPRGDADTRAERRVYAKVHARAREPGVPHCQPGQNRRAERDPADPRGPARAPPAPSLHPVLLVGAQEPVPTSGEQNQSRPRHGTSPGGSGAEGERGALRDRRRGVPDTGEARVGQRGAPEQHRGRGRHRGDRRGHEGAPLAAQRVAAGRARARGLGVEQSGRAAARRAVRRDQRDDCRHESVRGQPWMPAKVRARAGQLLVPRGKSAEDPAAGWNLADHRSHGTPLVPPAVPPVLLLGAQEPRTQRDEQEAHRCLARAPAHRRGPEKLPEPRGDRGGVVRVRAQARLGQLGEPEPHRSGRGHRSRHRRNVSARVKGDGPAAVRPGARRPGVEQRGQPGAHRAGRRDPAHHRGDAGAPNALRDAGRPRDREPRVALRRQPETGGASGRDPGDHPVCPDQPPVPGRPGVRVLGAAAPGP